MSFLFEELTREECASIREQHGFIRGKEEGIKESSLSIAKKMKDENYTIDQIIKVTELTREQIEEL